MSNYNKSERVALINKITQLERILAGGTVPEIEIARDELNQIYIGLSGDVEEVTALK